MEERPNEIVVMVNTDDCRPYVSYHDFVIGELRKVGIPMGPGPTIKVTEGKLIRNVDIESHNPALLKFVWSAE